MNQLARGEAPYRGEPFLGLAEGASALVDALFLSGPHVTSSSPSVTKSSSNEGGSPCYGLDSDG
jgi:hypothetical protein